jgi:glycosyltransferase involved in cell wall biosynthesis
LKLSFVIPCHNSARTLEACLVSIQKASRALEASQVIVVDNASTDITAKIAREFGVEVVEAQPASRSRARNAGLAHCKHPWVAFVDSDVILDERWAVEMLLACEREGCAGGQGPITPTPCYPVSLSHFRRRAGELKTQKTFNALAAKSFESPLVNTAACLYRRVALEECGGFDPMLPRHEDIDLSKRICRNGWSFRCVPSARAQVQWSEGGWWSYLQRAFWVGHYKNAYNKKWFARASLSLEWKLLKSDLRHLGRDLETYRRTNDFFWLQRFIVELVQRLGKLYSLLPYLLTNPAPPLPPLKASRLRSTSPTLRLRDSIRLIETPPTAYLLDSKRQRIIDLNAQLSHHILVLVGWKTGHCELTLEQKYSDFLESQ